MPPKGPPMPGKDPPIASSLPNENPPPPPPEHRFEEPGCVLSGECAASAEALESAASRHLSRAGHSGVLRRVGRGRPALKTGLPVLVVDCPLVLVREHVVGIADLLEVGLGLLLRRVG